MQENQVFGLFFIILGTIIFIVFAGRFLFEIAAIIVSLGLINYGLLHCGYPPLSVTIKNWFYNLRFRQ